MLVYDNGKGMAPNVLKLATSFGGSMSYGNRKGIRRFGMGMKTAALSISPVMELYSWQELAGFYNIILDTDAIGRDKGNLVALPEPTFNSSRRSQSLICSPAPSSSQRTQPSKIFWHPRIRMSRRNRRTRDHRFHARLRPSHQQSKTHLLAQRKAKVTPSTRTRCEYQTSAAIFNRTTPVTAGERKE